MAFIDTHVRVTGVTISLSKLTNTALSVSIRGVAWRCVADE